MKPLLAVLASVLLGFAINACGSSTASRSLSATTASLKQDRDDDGDNNDDDSKVIYYGHAPNLEERRSIVALVRAYYESQASEDGAAACRLLMPFVAESVAEHIGHSPGLRGQACSTVMSKLFRLNHALLSGENASLEFYSVRVNGGKALTVLSFANLPEVRQLSERRDSSGNWKVLSLRDGILE